jgi:phosphoglycolate phosphatase
MYKLVIFDLDGTLLDTIEDLASGVNHSLRACGCRTLEVDECRKLVGHGVKNLLRDSLPQDMRTEVMLNKMSEHFFAYYNEHIADFTKPYAGIPEALREIASKGIKLAVASNKFQAGTEELVEKFFGDINFVKVLGQREGFPIKPDAGVVFEIMTEVPEIDLEEVLYCGDSDVDIQTGNNAGVNTLAVTWGFRTREELEAYKPLALIDRPEELIQIISKS